MTETGNSKWNTNNKVRSSRTTTNTVKEEFNTSPSAPPRSDVWKTVDRCLILAAVATALYFYGPGRQAENSAPAPAYAPPFAASFEGGQQLPPGQLPEILQPQAVSKLETIQTQEQPTSKLRPLESLPEPAANPEKFRPIYTPPITETQVQQNLTQFKSFDQRRPGMY